MKALNLKTLTAAALIAAVLAPSAQAASLKRGGWDGNGLSVSGTVQAGPAGKSQGAQLRYVELPAAAAASAQ